MSDTNEITSALKQWAVKEMGFHRADDRDQKDTIQSIDLDGICLGPLVDVWSYVIKHIKSDATVHKITGNLKLNPGLQIEDKKKLSLLKERDKLQLEIAELTKTTKILNDSINETTATVHQKEKELLRMQQAFKDFKRSTFLLHSVKNKMQSDVKHLKQVVKDLEKNLQSLLPRLVEKESNQDSFRIDIEKMCRSMQTSLDELLNKDPNMEKINQTKLDVGSNLATLLDTLPHPLFMQLIEEQQKSEVSLKAKIETLGNEANSHLQTIVPGELQPLQKLLYSLSWFHAQCRFRADSSRLQTERLKSEMVMLKADITEHLKTNLGCEDQLLSQVLLLVDLEIQVSSRKAATKSLTENIKQLDDFCLSAEANQQEIEHKIETIERNSRIADHLSALICTLARKHADNSRAVQQSVTRLQGLVERDVKCSQNDLSEGIRVFQSNSGKELELYKQVKPCQLFHTKLESKLVPISRLAMNRFLPMTTGPSLSVANLESALKHLSLSQNTAVFAVFQVVSEKQSHVQQMQHAIKWHETRQREMLDRYGLSWLKNGMVHYDDLEKRLKDKRSKQEAELLPVLESRLKKMEEATEITNEIQVSMNEWCNEPTKLIETGRTVNGRTLEEWRSVWNKSLTMCRKKV